MNRTLAEAAAACGGVLQGKDAVYGTVSSDSRRIAPGDLFVALKGEHFDGHDFLHQVAASGAAGALVSRVADAASAPTQIVVHDTLQALTALARAWRAQFTLPVIGVAGSNGKTTVKEMIAAILAQAGGHLATQGNLNNHIGVPLTLMRLQAGHRSAVIEIGANRPGEVAALAAVARPTIGLITNAGAEHLEGFGDLDGVARAEGEMVQALPADGVAVINADDPYAPLWRQLSGADRVVTFGLAAAADFRASNIEQTIDEAGFRLLFDLYAGRDAPAAPVRLGLAGLHNVRNALAAAAAAHAAGLAPAHIVAGLGSVTAVSGRLQFKRARCGAWLIDDSYNANPGSMQAALETLAGLKTLAAPADEKWLVLADMAELGEHGEHSHRLAGEQARLHGISRLFATGPLSRHAVQTFGAGSQWFEDAGALRQALQAALDRQPRVTVLIKGSRFNHLERLVAALVSEVH